MTTHRIDTAGRPTKARPQLALPIALTMLLLTGALSIATATAASSTPTQSAATPPALPAGLDERDWQAIRARIIGHRQARAFEAMPDASADVHTADNPVHGFAIRYAANGATELTLSDRLTAEAASHRITLQPVALGYGARLTPLSGPLERTADGVRVDTVWHRELREWWVNDADGLEQWFELAAPPAGRGDDGASAEPLRLEMELHSSLDPVLVGSGPAQHLSLSDGTTQVRFEKLHVEDATGRRLPAALELDRQPGADRLAYVIDDRDALYPLTIDPTFVQQAYLKASNTGENDAFGYAVAISGDTVVVGAFIESSSASGVDGHQGDDSASASGAAYVFVRNGESWSQQAYLKASNAELGDQFGWSVAISGDTVVVGANAESSSARGVDGDQDDNAAPASGAVYVFVREGSNWTQEAYIKASNTDPLDRFGHSVAISGDRLVVGAPFEDGPFTRPDISDDPDLNQRNLAPDYDAGAVYVFVRNEGSWAQQVYLKPNWNDRDDRFGHSVAISGATVVIGSPYEDGNGTGILPSDPDSALPPLGSPILDDSAPGAGAVWVFEHDPDFFRFNGWEPQAYVKASNTDANDGFGSAIAISGDTLVVGAPGESSDAAGVDGEQGNNSASGAGAVYVFQRSENGTETVWQQQAYLKASNTGQGDQFGGSVAISGDTLVIGAARDDSNAIGVNGDQNDNSTTDSGAAYLFLRSGDLWQQEAYLKASNTDAFDAFGFVVALSGTTAVIGAPAECSNATGVDGDQHDDSAAFSGAGYVFDLATFSIGGNVGGLAGSGLLLQNNGRDPLAIAANGVFTFSRALVDGSDYDVTVALQPSDPNQFCAVLNGAGTLNGADIDNVAIECVAAFTVGGSVGELALPGLVLGLNGDSLLLFDRGASFTFPDALAEGSTYLVEVLAAPSAHDCTVANASGTIGNEDIDNVQVTCTTDIEFADSFESLEPAPVEL